MVILHVKTKDDKNTFLYEKTVRADIAELISELVFFHNQRLKILELAEACEGLATFGPLRPEESRGLTDEVMKLSDFDPNIYGERTNPDPNNFRCGVPPNKETAEMLKKIAQEVKTFLDAEKVKTREIISKERLIEEFEKLRGALMLAYPAFNKLPSHDPAREILEDTRSNVGCELEVEKTTLWWAGKEMIRGNKLEIYVGKNEKTKVIVRLCPKSAGSPMREPRIDEETHKAMVEYAMKKKREQEELEKEDDDDTCFDSEWTNPKGLRNSLINGGREIRFRP